MTTVNSYEVNFDGLVGLTHNYAGLSYGNVASSSHGGLTSSPRAAALQGAGFFEVNFREIFRRGSLLLVEI